MTEYDLPPHQALKLEADGALKPMWPELVDLRDEQVGKLVVDNGSTYAATVDGLPQAAELLRQLRCAVT